MLESWIARSFWEESASQMECTWGCAAQGMQDEEEEEEEEEEIDGSDLRNRLSKRTKGGCSGRMLDSGFGCRVARSGVGCPNWSWKLGVRVGCRVSAVQSFDIVCVPFPSLAQGDFVYGVIIEG
jgi:hypothetical protein